MRVFLVIMVVALYSLGGAFAQQTIPPLTEELAVRLALDNSPLVAMSSAESGMARARLEAARAEQKLQVSANGLATVSTMPNAIQTAGVMPSALLTTRDRAAADLNLMVMVPLSTGGRLESSIAAAAELAGAGAARLDASRVQVAYEARMRLAQWQAAVAALQVAQESSVTQEEQTRVAEQLVNAGKVARFDLLRNQAARAARQQAVARGEAEVATAQARMAEIVAGEVSSCGAPSQEIRPALPEDLASFASAQRPDLQAAQAELAAAEAAVQVRKASYQPQIYGVGMADLFSPASMGDSTGISVGVVAGLPLVDGGRRRSEVSEAEQAVLRARASVQALELQVRAEVAAAQARLAAARTNTQTAQAQVVAAEEGYRLAQVRYQAGKSIVVESLDSLAALTEAKQNQVQVQAELSMAFAEVYRAVGMAEAEGH